MKILYLNYLSKQNYFGMQEQNYAMCGKHHLVSCMWGTKACYKCRQTGHKTSICPTKCQRSCSKANYAHDINKIN